LVFIGGGGVFNSRRNTVPWKKALEFAKKNVFGQDLTRNLVGRFVNVVAYFKASAPLLYGHGSDRSRALQQAMFRYVSELVKRCT
jgi:hypothetical protein